VVAAPCAVPRRLVQGLFHVLCSGCSLAGSEKLAVGRSRGWPGLLAGTGAAHDVMVAVAAVRHRVRCCGWLAAGCHSHWSLSRVS
jgi:hypothetical protein